MQTAIDKTDRQLIREYVESGSQSAFSELAARHADWIYCAAQRQVRDPGVAEDVAQAVFIVLARKAHTLRENSALNAWLFRATRYAAGHALRAEARRKRHERTAASMKTEICSDTDSIWRQVEPGLDQLVARLREEDRAALLLRFYQQKSMADVGAALNVSEHTAKKRVARAVERLRASLRGTGITLSAADLATALFADTTHPAPPALLASCGAAASGPGSAAAIHIATKTMSALVGVKLKLALAALVLAILIPVTGAAIYFASRQPDWQVAVSSPAPPPSPALADVQSMGSTALLQGTWAGDGYSLSSDNAPNQHQQVVVKLVDNRFMVTGPNWKDDEDVRFAIDTTKNPPWIDIITKNQQHYRGIFALNGDRLEIRNNHAGGARPTDFITGPFENHVVAYLTRQISSPDAAKQGHSSSFTQATPVDTLLKLTAAIRDDSPEDIDACVWFDDPKVGQALRVIFLTNAAICRTDQAWLAAFDQHLQVEGFDFDVFPGLHGGFEELFKRTLDALTPPDVKIDGQTATVSVHVLRQEMEPFGQGEWANAALVMRLVGDRWLLDAPASIQGVIDLQPKQADGLGVFVTAETRLAHLLDDTARAIKAGELKTPDDASARISRQNLQCLHDLNLTNLNVNVLPNPGG
jgi:RNA polymerase sigma factor (sigma-70 family)